MKIKVITNGRRNGLPVPDANVYIGTENGEEILFQGKTNSNGEVKVNEKYLIPGFVFRIRKFDDYLQLRFFECIAENVKSINSKDNPFSTIKGNIYLYRDY